MARTVACRLSERKPGQKQRPRLGGAGPLVVGGIGVPLGVGTQTAKLRTQVRHSCPEAHCPEVQVPKGDLSKSDRQSNVTPIRKPRRHTMAQGSFKLSSGTTELKCFGMLA